MEHTDRIQDEPAKRGGASHDLRAREKLFLDKFASCRYLILVFPSLRSPTVTFDKHGIVVILATLRLGNELLICIRIDVMCHQKIMATFSLCNFITLVHQRDCKFTFSSFAFDERVNLFQISHSPESCDENCTRLWAINPVIGCHFGRQRVPRVEHLRKSSFFELRHHVDDWSHFIRRAKYDDAHI